ncbi:hypothetical protein FTE28_21560 [Bacillus licheniformis]|uniref:hypothetical protein n=1 Tax=Bacillus licheniformis TaxID=1402 RepID=UPI0009424000|nr:hypothetical protein [Bacillus licheniformis]AWV39743.1 hypothetical protein CD200_04685 [Bacillus licheniformis]AZN80458.1 hypothetical protein CXG95_15605 [Bacillus licheniformis]PLS10583.1 hypothetical protein CWM45_20905 [Bacillus licheniformis]QNT74658.1 hypothetical protein FTE28_21560 [Bacillus licheniformis]RIU96810.1 hypothetical protein D1862_21665 [Bacillus licheniformis]
MGRLNYTSRNVYRLIQRYELISANCAEQADLLEDLPVSLTYEIARPSAESTEPKRRPVLLFTG